MADLLPLAQDNYDKSNEQRTRTTIEERLTDLEAIAYSILTSYGTLSLGEESITLANGANNNVGFGYATYVRIIGPTGAFNISGITNGERGRIMFLRNTTSQAMTINNESGSSDAANRIVTQSGADYVSTGGGSVVLVYDSQDQRWIVIAEIT